jgi:excisionase family DNA binding protein
MLSPEDDMPRTTSLTTAEAPPAWVPLSVASDRVSLCERTIRRAIANGELSGFKFGKALRVRLNDIDAWAESKAIPNARSRGRVA